MNIPESEQIVTPEEMLESFLPDDFDLPAAGTDLHELRNHLKNQTTHIFNTMTTILRNETDAILFLAQDFTTIEEKLKKLDCPLAQLREEVQKVYVGMDASKQNLGQLVEKMNELRLEKKMNTDKLSVLAATQKNQQLLDGMREDSDTHHLVQMDLIERMTDQCGSFVQINLLDSKPELAVEISAVMTHINRLLNDSFIFAIKEKNMKSVQRALQIYIHTGNINEAEQVVRTDFVRVIFKDIITEQHFQSLNGNLDTLYDEVQVIVTDCFGDLINVVKERSYFRLFDFAKNSIIVEINNLLCLNLYGIVAPGDPNVFHKNFTASARLLTFLVGLTIDPERVVESYTFNEMNLPWNFDVYYKLRSREVLGIIEPVLLVKRHFSVLIIDESTDLGVVRVNDNITIQFDLYASVALCKAILHCFNKNIFLSTLTDKFCKLFIDSVCKYLDWLSCNTKHTSIKETARYPHDRKDFVNKTQEAAAANGFELKLKFLVSAWKDIHKLISFLTDVVEEVLAYMSAASIKYIADYVNKAKSALRVVDDCFCNQIVYELVINCHITGLVEIPRLFRRTNRAYPTAPSAWVSNIFEILSEFANKYQTDLMDSYDRVIHNFINNLNNRIRTQLNILLQSLGRTQMSLRRLKTRNNVVDSSSSTDDAKIREQVRIDIIFYINEAKSYSQHPDDVQFYEEMQKISIL